MPEKLGESQPYRSELAKQLRQEKDREKRREILDQAKEAPEYETANKEQIDSRQEMRAEKDRQKESAREQERAEYLKEVEILKFKFESKIDDTNRLVDQFFAGFNGNVNEVQPPESLDAVADQIKALNEKLVGGRDYIARASQILLQLRRLEVEIQSDVESHTHSKTQLASRIAEVQAEINQLKSQGLVKRMVARSEIGKRQQEVKDLNKSVTMEDRALSKDKAQSAAIYWSKDGLQNRMFNLMKSEMKEVATREIGQSLKELWDKVDGSVYFTEAMGRMYIDETVIPALDKIIEERKQREREHYYYHGSRIDENFKREFVVVFKEHVAEKSDASRGRLQQMMSDLPSEVTYVCQPLVGNSGYGTQGPSKGIMFSLFVQYGIDKVVVGKKHFNEARKKMKETALMKEADDVTRRDVASDYHLRYPDNFDELPYSVKWPISIGSFDRDTLPNMPLWSVARNVPLVRQGFGGTAELLDRKYNEKILQESLTDRDGNFIDYLCYYPNPDSIKTLVLIAAADFRSYRTVHANWAFDKLSKRPDWPKLLDEAEKKYPELKEVRSALEHWKGGDQQRNEEIVGRANDLAVSLIEKEPGNELQSRLAEEVLPNEKLIGFLKVRIKPEDADLLKRVNEMVENREITDYNFGRLLRQSLLQTTRLSRVQGIDMEDLLAVAKSKSDNELAAMLVISQKAVEVQGDASALHYLTSASVIEKMQSSIYGSEKKGVEPPNMDVFLSAYKDIPNMSGQQQILETFCEFFEGQETIDFYKKLYELYGNDDENFVATIARLAGKKELMPERILELGGTIKTDRGEVNFLAMNPVWRRIALSRPKFFLETNDGLDLLAHTNKENGLDDLDPQLDRAMGAHALKDQGYSQGQVGLELIELEMRMKILPLFREGSVPNLDQSNWKGLLTTYIGLEEGHWGAGQITPSRAEEIRKVFESGDARDVCLAEMKKLWTDYLNAGKPDEFPISLRYINEFIKNVGGAGPLSQVGSLSTFTRAHSDMLQRKGMAPRTKEEIAQGLATAERRFTKERWSNEGVSDFYNVSRDVMNAAPSLFSSYFSLFEKLKLKEFKEFSEELFPLHRVILSLSEKRGRNGGITHDSRDLVRMRNSLENLVDESGRLKPAEAQRKELTDQILTMFKDKFGIVKMPEHLNAENIRALSDYSMYLANLSGRNAEKEDILGFYLALAMNDKWEDYRCGVEINPEEYLTSEKAARLKPYLENRAKLNPVTPENLGIAPEKMPEFMKTLEEESENVAIGNVETVDVKLNNVITNLRGLEDPDLYPDGMDRKRMQLLLEHGNKKMGAVAAKFYQSLANPGKSAEISGEEADIRKEVEDALKENGLEVTAESVKKHFQDEIKPLAVVANILRFTEEIGADKEIAELQKILHPSEDVVAVFNKMGEEFKPTSGAIAISQDLEYLDNLIVKQSGELSEQESKLVKDYLAQIREKLAILEDIYDLVGKKFASMKQGQSETKNDLLRSKLDEIANIINRPDSQQMIASTLTRNLPYIIENIRECLSCVRQGANNDTNLTFGDQNKFYLSSRSEMKAASISDEVVFFEPVTFLDRGQEMAFVLDRIYGMNTPAVLVNQVEAVYKKLAKLKREFPEAKVSILVTEAAAQTGGASMKLLIERLREKTGGRARIEETLNAQVDVAESAAGDHYVEFGGNARDAGVRQVNGVSIRL